MKKALLVVVLLLLAILTSVLEPPETSVDPTTIESQRSKRLQHPYGYPDRFVEYHAQIRGSALGDQYPPNYQLTEYYKALRALKHPGIRIGWVSRGPGNVGGRTRPIVVDPDDPDRMTWYAGAVSGGLWRTTDGGRKWTSLTDDLPNLAVSALAMAGSDHDIMYMGTGEGFQNTSAVSGAGVFKSTDRGATWQQLMATATDPDFRWVNRLAVDPGNANVVVAATNSGIFRTENGGMSWTDALTFGCGNYSYAGRVQDLQAQPANFGIQIATLNCQWTPSPSAIIRSADGGKTWERAYEPSDAVRMEVAWSHSSPDVVYASIDLYPPSSDLARSDDAGATWALTKDAGEDPVSWLGSQGWYDQTIAVHPYSPDTVFVGGIFLWRIVVGPPPMSGPSAIDYGTTDLFMDLAAHPAGTQFGGVLALGIDQADVTNVEETDYVSIEWRFGQGSQFAHRFTVLETGGTNGDGGEGIPYGEYSYQDYVEVPFQVWDTGNNRQLMVSFRDQADDGNFDLIRFSTQGARDDQSREYVFLHRQDYRDHPDDDIAQEGGVGNGQLYLMWPHLIDDASVLWDPASLPNTALRITYERSLERERIVDQGLDPSKHVHVDHHNITIIPRDEATNEFWVINANDGGVAFSKDGGVSFEETDRSSSNYVTSQFYGIAKRPGTNQYIGGTQDNGTWLSGLNPDDSEKWSWELSGDGFDAIWHATDDKKLIGSLYANWLARSLNGGVSWESARNGLTDAGWAGSQFITSLGYSDKVPDRVFAIGASGVWRSEDFGGSWTVSAISDKWGYNPGKVRASKADPDIVWAGNRMDSRVTLHVSTDGGQSFHPIVAPNHGLQSYKLSGLNTHPEEDSTAYALFSYFGRPKVWETKDLGQTWTDLSNFYNGQSTNGFPDVAVYDLLVMLYNTDLMWAATEIGIFASNSSGQNWQYANNGIPAASVWQLLVRDDQIVAATHGRGIWTVPLGEVVVLPVSFADSVEHQTFTVGAEIAPLELPEATGGIAPHTYTLTPGPPAGLDFNANTHTISGTPAAVAPSTVYTYAVTDDAGSATSLVFNIEVVQAVSFAAGVADQSFPRAQPITPLVLPEATGGATPIDYTLTPRLPVGLAFSDSTRTISGTPTVVTDSTLYTYTGTGVNGSTDSLLFSIKVFSPVDAQQETLPFTFALRGNYPNPFQEATNISFDLPWPANVRVDVTDVLGRRVLALPYQDMAAGWGRSIRLDGAALASGHYVYRVHVLSPEGVAMRVGVLVHAK